MKKFLSLFAGVFSCLWVNAQWTPSTTDLTTPISRTGNLSLTGTGSYLTLTSRVGGGSNGTILFQNGTEQNLILAETAANNWTIGYGAAGTVPTSVISWNSYKSTTFAGAVTANNSLQVVDPQTNWNIGFGMNGDPARFVSADVINSAIDSDPLELAYSRGPGVIVGNSTSMNKYLQVNGPLMVSGTSNYLSLASRYTGANHGNILFSSGTYQNLILAETATDTWTLGYGALGTVPTSVITWNAAKSTTFAGATTANGNLRLNGPNGYAHSELQFYRADGAKFASIGQGDLNSANSTFDIQHFNGNDIRFLNNGTEQLRILAANGNVGIGNNNPDAKLAVSGQVHAQEVKVSVAVPGPDYVFEKEYKLTSLEEIKNYIDQNKHLPEVPSAKEMEKNGVQLGEMNMLLLKKIEELTLYVIELKMENKKFIGQQEELEKLKSQIKSLEGRVK